MRVYDIMSNFDGSYIDFEWLRYGEVNLEELDVLHLQAVNL